MNPGSIIYYLSLGSNMGDRLFHLEKALEFLETIGQVIRKSSIVETEPVGMAPGTERFLNMAVEMDSHLRPEKLLNEIKRFEKEMGRDIEHSHNLPRVIDIDILMAGDWVIQTESLTIPHKEMANRLFVLEPLNEIAPELIHPVLKKTIHRLLYEKNTI